MMPMTADQIKRLIEDSISGCEAFVDGDGTHFQATVVSSAFNGLSPVKKHQLVYQALGDRMQSEIHAISIQTYTPEEWARSRKFRVL